MLAGQLDMFGGATLPTIEAKAPKARKAKSKPVASNEVDVIAVREIEILDADFRVRMADMECNPIPRRRSVSPGGTLDDAGDATMDYLHGQLAASFQATIGDDPKMAIALLIASTLSHRGPVPSLPISGIMLDSEDRTSAPCLIVAEHRFEAMAVLTSIGVTAFTAPAKSIPLLMGLDRDQLDLILAHLVARSAVIGWDREGAAMLRATGATPLEDWRIEPSYLKTLSTGQVRELAEELLPIDDLPSKSSPRAKVEEAILEAARHDAHGWTPPQLAEIE